MIPLLFLLLSVQSCTPTVRLHIKHLVCKTTYLLSLTVTYCHVLSLTVTVNSTTNKEVHLHSYGFPALVTPRCSIGMADSHMRALYNQNSHEALLFQYCYHVIDCSVLQCVQSGLETRDDVSSLVAWLG